MFPRIARLFFLQPSYYANSNFCCPCLSLTFLKPAALKAIFGGHFFWGFMPKISYIHNIRISVKNRRMVNYLVVELNKARRWTTHDFAIEFGEGYTVEELQRHLDQDGSNSFIIARSLEVHGLPTQPSTSYMNGSINKLLKRHMQAAGLTYPQLVRRLYRGIPSTKVAWYVEHLQKFFQNGSTDAWTCALLLDVFGLKTLNPEWYLSPIDHQNPKYREQLEFRV